MGLLDMLQGGGDANGGLLSFLKSLQPGQGQQPDPSALAQYGQSSNVPVGDYSMPMFSGNGPMNANAQAAPQSAPPQAAPPVFAPQPPQAQQQAAPPATPGIGDRVGNALQSIGAPNSLFHNMVTNPLTALITGQTPDQAQQGRLQNLTAQALLAKGVDPAVVQAAVLPGNTGMLKTLVDGYLKPKDLISTGEGHLYDPNLKKDIATYEPKGKATFTSYKDANGNEIPGVFDPDERKFTPLNPGAAATRPSAPASIEDLQKSDPAMASQVQAVLDGRAPYPTGSRLNSKQQQLKELVTQVDPTFDASASRTRAKFNMEFGSTSPSTVGGQKILMGTALGHLGEVADSATKLHNSNGLGWAPAGHLYNSIANTGTDNAALANALNDKVAKFSGEAGKLYSGSQGGGVHEREDTRARMGAHLTSAELASGLEASRDLILSKQKALEDQATSIFGPEKAAKYDFVGPDGRKALDKIEQSIVKLRGGKVAPEKAPESQGSAGDAIYAQARDAIARGAPREKVLERLKQNGIDASGL